MVGSMGLACGESLYWTISSRVKEEEEEMEEETREGVREGAREGREVRGGDGTEVMELLDKKIANLANRDDSIARTSEIRTFPCVLPGHVTGLEGGGKCLCETG